MAAEQRIVGGGLLIAGIAVVLILLYFFAWGGGSPEEGLQELRNDIFPAYQTAAEKADYVEMKRLAARALAVLDEHGRTAILKSLQGDAATGNKEARRLHDLAAKGGFEKNSEGLYEFRDHWYPANTHRALGELAGAVEEKLRTLRRIRRAARDARQAIEDARAGSGHDLPLPAAEKIEEELKIIDRNPVFESDSELYRVFGLAPGAVEAALATSNPGGKATSARLRWNRDVVGGDLAQRVQQIPELVEDLATASRAVRLASEALAKDEANAATAKRLYERAATLLAEDLEGERKARFDENRAAFEEGDALARVLKHESRMLEPYLVTIRELGKTFASSFAK